jgi:hypothetical protein
MAGPPWMAIWRCLSRRTRAVNLISWRVKNPAVEGHTAWSELPQHVDQTRVWINLMILQSKNAKYEPQCPSGYRTSSKQTKTCSANKRK